MIWSTPKTDWSATDRINVADINRWRNNLLYLKKVATDLFGDFSTVVLYDKKTTSSVPLASELNAVENSLEEINENTYNYDIGETKTYSPNGHPWNYEEMNRVESAMEKIYRALATQTITMPHLAFTLGSDKHRCVPRVKTVDHEPILYRLEFRIGQPKGVNI